MQYTISMHSKLATFHVVAGLNNQLGECASFFLKFASYIALKASIPSRHADIYRIRLFIFLYNESETCFLSPVDVGENCLF